MSERDGVRIEALGPLRIRHGDREQGVNAPMERTLLALLVTRAGRLATSEWLIGNLWPGQDPRPEMRNTLQTYVSHLRPRLEPERPAGRPWRVLRREPNGYLLDIGILDVREFESLVEKGSSQLRSGDSGDADTTLTAALALWRADDAFTDVTRPAPVQTMTDELAARRLRAVKLLSRARIENGHPETVLGELAVQRGSHPFDEDLVRLSMRALHHCGRTADALKLYDATARLLADELGTDPGRALWETHRQILATTAAPTAAAPAAVPPPAPEAPGPRTRHRGLLIGASAVVVLTVVLLGIRAWPGRRPADDLGGAGEVYSTLELRMVPGYVHDLDVRTGQATVLPTGLTVGTPESDRGDLYRQKSKVDRLSGWATRAADTGYNTFEPTARDSDVTDCLRVPDTGHGNVVVDTLRTADKFCVHTHEGRWALITVLELPAAPGAAMIVQAVVLDRAEGS